MQEINYKDKYTALRAKYMEDMDMAFRLGMEQGTQQAQMDQAAQQQADAQAMQQAALQGQGGMGGEGGAPPGGSPEQPEQPGQPPQPGQGEQPGQPGGAPGQDAMAGQPTELDHHINKLQSMLGGSKDPEIKKSLDQLVSVRKAELQAIQFRKSEQAIKGIAKALHKPAYKMGALAQHNLGNSAKAAVSLQHKIVTDVMAKMEEEEKRAAKSVKDILNVEGLLKG